MRAATLLLAALALGGCSYSIHQVHVSDFGSGGSLKKGKLVSAEATRRIILGFDDDTDYVDDAMQKLMAKCKGGRIQGITTQFSTAHGFFHWTNKIRMEGLCING